MTTKLHCCLLYKKNIIKLNVTGSIFACNISKLQFAKRSKEKEKKKKKWRDFTNKLSNCIYVIILF